MDKVSIIKIPVSYVKPSPNKLIAYDFLNIEKHINFEVMDKRIVRINPTGFGGNHYHERLETWIAIGGELELVWKDGETIKTIIMNPKGSEEMQLITVNRNVPHMVRNKSDIEGFLFEYADQTETNAKSFDLINYPNK